MNVAAVSAMLLTSACAMVGVPEARNVDIPAPTVADSRKAGVNERPDAVMYLPLGEDVLVPEVAEDDDFPTEMVGPFELRGETLAGALQLILADYDISLAFETQEGLTRRVTVANLRGDLGKVVHQVCSLANLYCSYEDGSITIKDTQTFTVTLPPIGSGDDTAFLDDVASGLTAILGDGGTAPIVDPTTRTLVYMATQRTSDIAARYFQRLRANTAMIVFETYIWEVSLNAGNSTGVDWSKLGSLGKFNTGITINGGVGADFTDPISIGLPTTQDFDGTSGDIVRFLSQFGAVKTISQPQITVLSGAEAELRVADTQNYVSEISTTLDEGQSTTSVNTDSVDTGFTLTIGSTWDKSTVYANFEIELTDVKQIDDFTFSDTGDDGGETIIQLPQTSERQLSTQIRVRPGDSVLIAGLVRENDNFDTRGLGLMKPIIPDSRTAGTENLELVMLLRPRVIVYTASNDPRYMDYAVKKHHKLPGTGVEITSPKELGEPAEHKNVPNPDMPYDAPATKLITPLPAGKVSTDPNAPEPLGTPAVPVSPAPVSKVEPMPITPMATPVAPAAAAKPNPSVEITPLDLPPVTPAPVTPSWESSASAPIQPMPAPVAAPAPAPVLTQTSPPVPMSDDARFRRGEGFVSRSTYAPSSAIPLYNPNAAPAPAPAAATPPGPQSAYETYDYYTPTR